MKERKRLGLALCGSYCTYEKVLKEAEKLAADAGYKTPWICKQVFESVRIPSAL